MRGGGVGVVLVEADKVNNKASRVAKQTEKMNTMVPPCKPPWDPYLSFVRQLYQLGFNLVELH